MFPQGADAQGTLVDPLDEGGGGRDLVQRVVRDLEVFRERLADDVRQRLSRPVRMIEQGPPEATRDRGFELYPHITPPAETWYANHQVLQWPR